jgi:hypothetical protein
MHNNQVTMQLNNPKYKADQEEEEKFEYKSKRGRRKLAEENALVNDKKIKKKLIFTFLKD